MYIMYCPISSPFGNLVDPLPTCKEEILNCLLASLKENCGLFKAHDQWGNDRLEVLSSFIGSVT